MSIEQTVAWLKTLTISSLGTFLDRYPGEIKAILRDQNHWYFFMYAASLGILKGSSALPDGELVKLEAIIFDIDKDLLNAIEDFHAFISKNTDDEFVPSIGLWVVWNVQGSQPMKMSLEFCRPR